MSSAGLDFAALWAELERPDAPPVPAWLIDHQARSRQTREAILEGAAELIQARSWADIGLKAVAEAAGVSVGAVYARFPSKEAILTVLGLVVLNAARHRFEAALEAMDDDSTLRDLASEYSFVLVEQFLRYRRLIMELRDAAALPEIRAQLDRTNDAIHSAFLTRGRACVDQIGHSDPEVSLRYALFMTNAAAREACLYRALNTYQLDLDPKELAAHLAHALIAYLRAGSPEGNSRRCASEPGRPLEGCGDES